MYSCVNTAILCGITGILVRVEADISTGLPVFDMVGLPNSEVRESKERVRTALRNKGYTLPANRITVNLSPANIRKTGNGFDLPIALAILLAMGRLKGTLLQDTLVIGELGLDGQIGSVNGVLPMVIEAKEAGLINCILPRKNMREALLIEGLNVIGVDNLSEVVEYLNYGILPDDAGPDEPGNSKREAKEERHDFADINGQKVLRRACEVAASGMHNFLMIGPPGAGKTMVAKCMPSILPDMTEREKIEVSKIYSASGLFDSREGLMSTRPFRSPHHTITDVGLSGGNGVPKPGEISLAHCGILFLDELPEFKKSTLEILRQPMEDKEIHISRAYGTYTFPADFMLVAAMNPCSCGYYPNPVKCHCDLNSVKRYIGRISQPLLDRIDICISAEPTGYSDIISQAANESSEAIRKRVQICHDIQHDRYRQEDILFNSQLTPRLITKYIQIENDAADFIRQKFENAGISARSYHKLLKVSRTIADMAQAEKVCLEHVVEACTYKSIERKIWEDTWNEI